MTESLAVRLAISLAIGLLVGVERERRKGAGSLRATAGIRTFALAALTGGLSLAFGGELVLVAVALVIGALAVAGYRRSSPRDPGLTTEVALVTTVLLGALAVRQPSLASGLAVGVVVLLAARTRLHRFVRRVLTEQELHDALVFAAAALVILPLTPDRAIGPLSVLNPRTVWRLAVIFMAISGAGYLSLRLLGPGIGLALSGFVSGFVSSSATIAAMGARAKENKALRRAAVAGAVLSTVATFVQMAVLLAATSRATLWQMRWALLFGGVAAGVYSLAFAIRGLRNRSDTAPKGRPLRLWMSLVFAAAVTLATVASEAIHQWLGDPRIDPGGRRRRARRHARRRDRNRLTGRRGADHGERRRSPYSGRAHDQHADQDVSGCGGRRSGLCPRDHSGAPRGDRRGLGRRPWF